MPEGLTSGNDGGVASPAPGTGTPQAQPVTSNPAGGSPQAQTGIGAPQTGVQPQQPQQGTTETPKVNLFELPEFRNVQSQFQKQIAQERAERQKLAEQLKQVQRQNLPEDEVYKFEIQDREAKIQELQSTIEQQQLMTQIVQDFQELSSMSGMPVEELFDAYKGGKINNLVDAQQMAMRRMKETFEKSAAQRAEQLVQKQTNNEVVVGGGAPMGSDDMRSQKLREFVQKKDSVGYFRELMRSRQEQ